MTTITNIDRIETARAHILNIFNMYDIVECNMYGERNAGNDLAAFGELVAEFMAYLNDTNGWAEFPAWANIHYEHVCAALAQIVKEWEY